LSWSSSPCEVQKLSVIVSYCMKDVLLSRFINQLWERCWKSGIAEFGVALGQKEFSFAVQGFLFIFRVRIKTVCNVERAFRTNIGSQNQPKSSTIFMVDEI
jgi:hypothetical protein